MSDNPTPAALLELADQIRLLDECSGCKDKTDIASHAAQAVRDFAARIGEQKPCCDQTPTCPADKHVVMCLGLYVTEDELRDCVWPTQEQLEQRRRDHLSLTRGGHGRTPS